MINLPERVIVYSNNDNDVELFSFLTSRSDKSPFKPETKLSLFGTEVSYDEAADWFDYVLEKLYKNQANYNKRQRETTSGCPPRLGGVVKEHNLVQRTYQQKGFDLGVTIDKGDDAYILLSMKHLDTDAVKSGFDEESPKYISVHRSLRRIFLYFVLSNKLQHQLPEYAGTDKVVDIKGEWRASPENAFYLAKTTQLIQEVNIAVTLSGNLFFNVVRRNLPVDKEKSDDLTVNYIPGDGSKIQFFKDGSAGLGMRTEVSLGKYTNLHPIPLPESAVGERFEDVISMASDILEIPSRRSRKGDEVAWDYNPNTNQA